MLQDQTRLNIKHHKQPLIEYTSLTLNVLDESAVKRGKEDALYSIQVGGRERTRTYF